MKKLMVAVAVVGLMAGPALADSVHIGNTNTTNQGGQGGAGGSAAASSSSSATGGTHVQTNTQVNSQTSVNTNVNTQGQQQGQQQGQIQGQGQSADNKGNKQSTSIKVESSLIPGVAVAPGLTSGGSQVCLGSFSVGLSGPMAGIAFGKTVVDSGCEDRQHAILLFNMGYTAQALELLKGNERVKALFAPAGGVAATQAAVTIPAAMASTQAATVSNVQGN